MKAKMLAKAIKYLPRHESDDQNAQSNIMLFDSQNSRLLKHSKSVKMLHDNTIRGVPEM
jgi:hypothetical protein